MSQCIFALESGSTQHTLKTPKRLVALPLKNTRATAAVIRTPHRQDTLDGPLNHTRSGVAFPMI